MTLKLATQTKSKIVPSQITTLHGISGEARTIGKPELLLKFGNRIIKTEFQVLENLPFPCILGADFISTNKLIPDLDGKEFWFKDDVQNKFKIRGLLQNKPKLVLTLGVKDETSNEMDPRVKKILDEFPAVARTDGKFGRTDVTYHIIDMKGPPVRQRPYKTSPMVRKIIRENVQMLEQNGMIRPSRSPYASPVVIDQKKNGTWRLCIDYKKLNRQTKDNAGPVHNAHTILRQIPTGEGWYYSVIDLQSGYWQIMLDEDCIEKSAFVTEDGHWDPLVMGFGLKNAPKTFAALMNTLLKE